MLWNSTDSTELDGGVFLAFTEGRLSLEGLALLLSLSLAVFAIYKQ